MKYADAWAALRAHFEQDANASGEMMSLEEWVNSTSKARKYLKLMDRLEEEYE